VPYFDIYVRTSKFTHIEEWWEPDYATATELRNRTIAQIASSAITTYDGGTTAGGANLVAGTYWVGIVTKDANAIFNVNESDPVVDQVTIA
jgi:hypothetical protein